MLLPDGFTKRKETKLKGYKNYNNYGYKRTKTKPYCTGLSKSYQNLVTRLTKSFYEHV